MYKKTVSYVDYDGNQRNEDCYFHLSKTDILDMQNSVDGGLGKYLEKIVQEKDGRRIIAFVQKLILESYGEKSLDGKHFYKVKDGHKLVEDFMQTEAYSELLMTLAEDANELAAFVNGIIPADLAKKASSMAAIPEEK